MTPDFAWQTWLALWLFSPLFVAIAWTDLTQLRIPNAYCILGLALALAAFPFLETHEMLFRGLAAGICFVICFILFALGWFGGGDAKMLPVVILAIPSIALSTYMLLLAGAMALGLLTMPMLRMLLSQSETKIASMAQSKEFPMGLAIGLSGLVLAVWPLVSFMK